MPRVKSVPAYKLHKATGQARVIIDGQHIYLGQFGSAESKEKYARLLAEHAIAPVVIPTTTTKPEFTVKELAAEYWTFAEGYYVKNGEPTGRLHHVRQAMRSILELYGSIPAAEFSPLKLQAIQKKLIATKNTRRYINGLVDVIRRMFKWGVSQELVPAIVHQALGTVPGLRKGRTEAQEKAPISPVSAEMVDATLPHLSSIVADMIRLQRLTGCRPEELCLRDPSTHPFKPSKVGEVPTDWDVVPIESLVPSTSPICYGIVQVGPHTHGGVPTIAIRDLDDIRVENLHYTEPAREKRFARSRCQGGDVLISIKATTGRIGVAPEGFNGNISRDIARVRLLPSEWPIFFKYQLQSAAGQSRLDSITVGTTRKELSIIPLRLLLVSRPKPPEQEAVATRIQKSEADLLKLEDTIAKLRRLKSGLMHDLLTGAVPVTSLLSNPTK